MRYPTIPPRKVSSQVVEVFRGYNRNLKTKDGEFREMENLSSDAFPVLSPRRPRGLYRKTASPQGLIAKERLCYVDGGDFVIGDEVVPMGLSVAAEDCPKRLVSMGAYVVILPDKMYINTANPADFGAIEARFSGENVEFSLRGAEGEPLSWVTQAPEDPTDGLLWMDAGELKRYASSEAAWLPVTDCRVRLTAPGIGSGFAPGDMVTVSGDPGNGNRLLEEAEEDFVSYRGTLREQGTGSVTLERLMPRMDFLIESGNRLWGCRYGVDEAGKPVNEILACKLGDFRNWNCFQGLATDSYRASCGSDGPFTGAAAHMGYPIFFKEGCLHKVYGTEPAAFQIQTTACRGVQPGCGESLAVVGETLMYKSRGGVCRYDGSLPQEVSKALGKERYAHAAAGAIGDKYYISMADGAGKWHLFVYDGGKRLWHREDALHVSRFCAWDGELYAIDADSRNILGLLGTGEPEGKVSWMAETGELGMDPAARQYVSRLNLRLQLEPGAELECLVRYDGEPEWECLAQIYATGLRSLRIPLRLRRCDHLRLCLRGRGDMKLYSITKYMEEGSDLM